MGIPSESTFCVVECRAAAGGGGVIIYPKIDPHQYTVNGKRKFSKSFSFWYGKKITLCKVTKVRGWVKRKTWQGKPVAKQI